MWSRYRRAMFTVPELAAEALGDFLGNYMRRRFGAGHDRLVEMVPSIARIAIECIGNSDALYHNVEHTMLVTLAGHDITRGRALHTHMLAEDYATVIIACLTHDIGYVRGRAARLTPRCCPTMSNGRRCSCWSASSAWRASTASGSRRQSRARASPRASLRWARNAMRSPP